MRGEFMVFRGVPGISALEKRNWRKIAIFYENNTKFGCKAAQSGAKAVSRCGLIRKKS